MILDPKTSRRIFELARAQQDELAVMPDDDDVDDVTAAAETPRIQGMRTGNEEDDDDDENFDEFNQVEDAEEIFVRVLFLPHYLPQATHALVGNRCR